MNTFPYVFFIKLGFYLLFDTLIIYGRYTNVNDFISIMKTSIVSDIVYGV